jgi:uncharacterized phiE125 gp8 family phage protein
MPLELTTPPASEPITLAEAKAHLKVDTDADDALIERLIAAARARAEWHTGRAFVTQSWIFWLDAWPETIDLPLPPLQSVLSITAYTRADIAHTLSSSDYTVANNRIALKDGRAPPTDLRRLNAVAIAFTAGYGVASDVPAPLRVAILSLIAFLYEHRGEAPADLPQDILAHLAPYRVLKL